MWPDTRFHRAIGDDVHHPLAATPYLLCDPHGLDDDTGLSNWLRTRPCPLIGIGTGTCEGIGGKPRKTIGARVRGAATDGVVSLWKWNRARKKKSSDERDD